MTRINEVCQSHNDHAMTPEQNPLTQLVNGFHALLGVGEYISQP